MKKLVLATTSLAGCFGCHMSFLDMDERILELIERVEFDKSPLDDIKTLTRTCDIGLVEGGCCNTENVRILREFRKYCKVLIAVGQCAITGGLPAMRNGIAVKDLLEESYLNGPTLANQLIPNDEEIPILLDRIYPCHEVVKIDGFLPGCPPSGDAFWEAIQILMQGGSLEKLSYANFKFD